MVGTTEAGYVLSQDEKDPSPFPIAYGGDEEGTGKVAVGGDDDGRVIT